MKLQKPKGTVDILPGESQKWQKVEAIARKFFAESAYQEIRTPIFENYELFARSSGESSDVVQKEMYDFDDKGNRHIALRPEGTAGVVRAYVENKLYGPEYTKPYKVYYIGPMFRYERPQAGRQREFHQIGVETFGSSSPLQDVEVITLGYDLLQRLGIKHFELHLNSLGNEEVRQRYHDALIAYFNPHFNELSADSQRRLATNPLRILDSKDAKDKEIVAGAPKIIDYLDDDSRKSFDAVQNYLHDLSIDYVIDDDLVRGLDYYTGTIFEFMVADTKLWQSKSTVLGGGRYDKLVKEFSGPQTPAVGFGIGLERLMLVVAEQNPDLFAPAGIDFYVANVGTNTVPYTLKTVRQLRNLGFRTEFDIDQRKLKAQFKAADRSKAKYVITIGDDELAAQQLSIKNLATGQQIKLASTDLDKNIANKLQEME